MFEFIFRTKKKRAQIDEYLCRLESILDRTESNVNALKLQGAFAQQASTAIMENAVLKQQIKDLRERVAALESQLDAQKQI